MRFFSIRLISACILLPPVLYLLTVYVVERQLQERFSRAVEEISTGDPQQLLDGSVRLRDALRVNIDHFLRASVLVRHGLGVRVTVSSRGGKVLYPAPFEEPVSGSDHPNPMRVAQDNFALLDEGLVVQVEARLEHNRLLSNGILAVYVLAALLLLVRHYRSAGRRISREEAERKREFERLTQCEQVNSTQLAQLQRERETLVRELEVLKVLMQDERSRAERNEDDLIQEIDILEKKLADNLSRQGVQQGEIQTLKESLAEYEKEQRREDKGRAKAEVVIRRRLTTLYKNIAVNDRAVAGLADLNEEFRLKAEEVIHQLNSDPDLVQIKRKVFGKKNRETVLEVVFAYKGRLYFRKGPDRRVEVLAVGTKNTQEKELEFLASL
jgi:hypothetical protein